MYNAYSYVYTETQSYMMQEIMGSGVYYMHDTVIAYTHSYIYIAILAVLHDS